MGEIKLIGATGEADARKGRICEMNRRKGFLGRGGGGNSDRNRLRIHANKVPGMSQTWAKGREKRGSGSLLESKCTESTVNKGGRVAYHKQSVKAKEGKVQ